MSQPLTLVIIISEAVTIVTDMLQITTAACPAAHVLLYTQILVYYAVAQFLCGLRLAFGDIFIETFTFEG